MAAKGNGTATGGPPAKAEGSPVRTIKTLLEASKEQIGRALPRHMTPERMIQIATVATYKTPRLQECDPMSVVASVVQASELGLEPGGALGHGYLIPRYNKNTRGYACTFLPGYRGLLELARRSGQLANVQARVVHEGDDFEFAYGLEPTLRHRPTLGSGRGKAVAVYATARMRSGETAMEVMSFDEVEAIRARSQSPNDGPWRTDWSEMAKKTVLKRLLKLLPCSVELSTAIDLDNADYGPLPSVRLTQASGTRSAALAARLGAALPAPDPEPEFVEGTAGVVATEADEATADAELFPDDELEDEPGADG